MRETFNKAVHMLENTSYMEYICARSIMHKPTLL